MPGAKERPASRRVARVPQVMQMEALECGAACLAMILAYYGRWVPLEQLRVDCGVSRDGSKATNILKAARSYGLAAKGMTYLANALMRKGSLPCIAFWNFNHFVVVKGCKGKNVYINDPARGEVKVPFDEFEESFTGVALVFEKTDAFEEGGKKPDMKVYARKLLSGLGGAVAFVMVTAAIVSLVTVLNTSLKRVNIARAGAMANGKLYATTIGGVEMIETIKAAGAEIGYFGRWAGYQAAANEANVRTAQLNEYMGLLPTLVMQVANIAVLTLGVWLIVLGQMTPGMVLAFSGFLSAFMAPVVQLIGLGQSIQEMQTQAERIEDVMRYEVDVPEEPVSGDAGEKALSFGRDKLAGRVDMENVTFGYSPLEPPVIEDFNLHMEPGKWVAFVGGSGCGKSTIAKVASGLYKPWSGTVKFDGTPVDEIPRAILRGSLAVVDQDIVTFDDTVSNNVKLWDKSIEDYEVIMACRDAGIHDVVAARDGGYASRILPGGRNFSGGQLQRLEIARVLAQEPTVIVLDEATSALDEQTDGAVEACLKFMGVEAGSAPESVTDVSERIDWLCRPTGTMYRTVRLEGKWHRRAFGAMLGRLDTGEAVAVLPRGAWGYCYLEPGSGKKVKIDEGVAAHLEREAVLFYRPFPAKQLSVRDLAAFVLHTLDRRDYLLVLLACLAVALIGLVPPLANKIAYGTVVPSGQADLIAPIGALLLGVAVSTALIGACRNLVMQRVSVKLDVVTEAASFAWLLTLPTSFFKQYSSGDLGSRISNVTMLAQMIASVLLGSGLTALFSLIYVAQIAVFAPVLALPALVSFVGMVGTIVIFYLAGSSHVAMADYMAFSVAYGQVNGAIMGFAGTASTMAQIKPMLNSVAPIMEAVPEVSEERPNVDSLTGSIDVSGVSFRYGENMPYIVKDLSFRIRPGEYVALVGRSGCGKSTIMRLLLGFETPERGTIFYGPHETSKVDLRSLRRHIGVVMQDGKLFMGDVANNITISNPTATIDDAWEAAELAGIADDIRRMPMGMQTLVTEGGGGVSGGQRQRLMIARAICGKKKILMFDEATSALDNRTQKHVSDSLDSLNCTRLVIAHRLSTVRHCDRILVVDGGSIVEEGTYDELLAQGGVFAELVSRQRLDAEA